MKSNLLFIFLLMLLAACHSTPQLYEGTWSGTLTPMNHPDMNTPLDYEVSYNEGLLAIDISGPNSSIISTQNPRIVSDTLFFHFNEPEEQVTLNCELAKNESAAKGFSGRCTDTSGKWAFFTMIPPK